LTEQISPVRDEKRREKRKEYKNAKRLKKRLKKGEGKYHEERSSERDLSRLVHAGGFAERSRSANGNFFP